MAGSIADASAPIDPHDIRTRQPNRAAPEIKQVVTNLRCRLARGDLGTEYTIGYSFDLCGELVEAARVRSLQNRKDDRVVLGQRFYSLSRLFDFDFLKSGIPKISKVFVEQ